MTPEGKAELAQPSWSPGCALLRRTTASLRRALSTSVMERLAATGKAAAFSINVKAEVGATTTGASFNGAIGTVTTDDSEFSVGKAGSTTT